jgi:hypothetical protein
MKKLVFAGLFCLTAAVGFSQTKPLRLEGAAREGVSYLKSRLPRNSRVAVLNIESPSPELSGYALGRLSAALVNDGFFTVIERNDAALTALSREAVYQLSGDVSDETALSIGKQLGAEFLLSGALGRSGSAYRLDLKALQVETARVQAQWSVAGIRAEPSWEGLAAAARSATLAFEGDTLSERDRQVFTVALGRALEVHKVPLSLDSTAPDSAAPAGGGYVFTVTFYSEGLPAAYPANTALLTGEVSIALRRGSQVLRRGGPYRLTEMTRPLLVRRASEALESDREFFTALNP